MKSPSRKCKNSSDNFCYICGSYTTKKQRINITKNLKQVYLDYFQIKLGYQDDYWAPHRVCRTCSSNLFLLSKGIIKNMPFAIPKVCREPRDHVTIVTFVQ